MAKCIVCGKEVTTPGVDKCLDCSRKAIQQIFKERPEVKQAFKESIEEIQKPENMKKMVDKTCHFMAGIQALQKRGE